jgi:transcriptional regulator with XRE-family HTH domain
VSNRGFKHPKTQTRKVKSEVQRLCAAIQARRKILGVTQEMLAEKADISVGMLAQLETGHRVPSLPMLVHLCLVLKLDIQVLPR